jgi:plasmid stabilization system protein ParE
MTGGYILSPRAQRDMVEIWDYTAENWGDDQAESYVLAI